MGSLTSVAARPPAPYLTTTCVATKTLRRPRPRLVTMVGGGAPVQRLVRLLLSELDVTCSLADCLDEASVDSDLVLYCCAGLDPQRLAKALRLAWAPLIVLTTDDREDARLQALDLGVSAVVLMPFEPAQLLGLASYLLRGRYETAR